MIIFKRAIDITRHVDNERLSEKKIGFVPTMGALHNGHLSLITRSKSENDITIASIFVNPAQFNNTTDFEKYPVTIENDIKMLEESGCDVLFLPSVDEIYPPDFIKQHYELGYLEEILESKHRPGHFQGVCLVVERLLSIIPASVLYLGKKDYQQCMVIRKMTELKKININIKECETIREEDGLALSSRNKRLSDSERKKSVAIYEALSFIKNNISSNNIETLKKRSSEILENAGFEIDYIEICDISLHQLVHWDKKSDAVALIAASINDIRLIDNMTISPEV